MNGTMFVKVGTNEVPTYSKVTKIVKHLDIVEVVPYIVQDKTLCTRKFLTISVDFGDIDTTEFDLIRNLLCEEDFDMSTFDENSNPVLKNRLNKRIRKVILSDLGFSTSTINKINNFGSKWENRFRPKFKDFYVVKNSNKNKKFNKQFGLKVNKLEELNDIYKNYLDSLGGTTVTPLSKVEWFKAGLPEFDMLSVNKPNIILPFDESLCAGIENKLSNEKLDKEIKIKNKTIKDAVKNKKDKNEKWFKIEKDKKVIIKAERRL